MNNHLVTEEDLKALTGKEKRSAIMRHLEKAGIEFHAVKNGSIYTTIDAINASMGINNQKPDSVEF